MIKTVEMDFQYQQTIQGPPISPEELFGKACSSDAVTINTWRQIWIDQYKANHDKYGPFKANSVGTLFNKYARQPVIIVGSGPSLKNNVDELKDTKGIPIVSCLHNFHFLHDKGIKADYFVTLDAGPICVEEVSEGGSQPPEVYWEATKDHTLIAFCGTHPDLIARWKGKVLWFNAPVPEETIMKANDAVEPFGVYVSNGGNVLGACQYIAKAVMGCNPVVFTGADFSFSYTNKFHGWESKYDKSLGHYMRTTDVWGNKVSTWQSYYNFKCFFDSMACKVPGIYVNATEGGILGAYDQGNIQQIVQMPLKDVINMYGMNQTMRSSYESPELNERKLLF